MKIKYLDDRLIDSPTYATQGSAGLDCYACIAQNYYIYPQETATIPLGFCLSMENPNLAGLLIPRSGFGKKGLILANSIGLIDSDYQGEIVAVVWNRNENGPHIEIKPMSRIAQLIFVQIQRPTFVPVLEFEPTTRGTHGFGSTGI